MQKLTILFCAPLALMALASCEFEPERQVELLRESLTDLLECQAGMKPSTIEAVEEALSDPEPGALAGVLMRPELLARAVSMVSSELEGAVVLVRNVGLLLEQGHVQTLLNDGLQEPSLDCGDALTLACTAGQGTSTVRCDEEGEVDGVQLDLDGCVLQESHFQGGAWFAVDSGDASRLRLQLDRLLLDEVKELDGGLVLERVPACETLEMALGGETPLQMLDHGGVEGGLSCGETTRIERLRASHEEARTDLDLAMETRSQDGHTALRSLGEVIFVQGDGCACPLPGAAVELTFTEPLPWNDEQGTMRVYYREPSSSEQCADVEVEVVEWPEECLGAAFSRDCGREASRSLMEGLLGALCRRF